MHELSVTQRILEIALKHGQQATTITDIHLVIGQLSSMVDDCIQFYWDLISEGTTAQGACLHFKRLPAIMRCQHCQTEYPLQVDCFACPTCDSTAVELITGDEFYVESIQVEGVPIP